MLVINGIELEFDMTDADTYEKYMAGAGTLDAAMGESLGDAPTTEEYVEMVRKKCQAVRTFVDGIFGEGMGKKLCPKDSLNSCLDVQDAIIDEVYRQNRETEEKTRIRAEKKRQREEYSRSLKENRAQKTAEKEGTGK